MKNNSSGITGTRRILPKEVYELEGEEEKEGKPKGWLSWFQGIYRRDVQEDDLTPPEPSIVAAEVNPQSASSGQDGPTLNDFKPTSILSKILPTPHKDSADNTMQMKGNPKKLTTDNNSSRD